MNKFFLLGAAVLVSLLVMATSSGVAMAKGGDDKPVEVTGTINAEIVAPTTGHDIINVTSLGPSAQGTVTFTQNVMVRHVQLLMNRIGDPTDLCSASARKTNPSDDSFFQTIDNIGEKEWVTEEFNFGSGVKFLAGEDMTMFVGTQNSDNQCHAFFIYFFDILD